MTNQTAALDSRSFIATAPRSFWADLVSAMPIVLFWRGLRQALSSR